MGPVNASALTLSLQHGRQPDLELSISVLLISLRHRTPMPGVLESTRLVDVIRHLMNHPNRRAPVHTASHLGAPSVCLDGRC